MSREELIQRAKLAEQAERFDDMVTWIKAVVEFGNELTNEERNLFSLAFKNAIGARRTSWRVLSTIEQNADTSQMRRDLARKYRELIEKEISDLARTVIDLIDKCLLPKVAAPDQKVFYLKMKADYSRYIAEVAQGDALERAIATAKQGYEEGSAIAEVHMRPVNPIRLGLVLNFSVFYYEIAKEFEKACELAKKAFDAGVAELDTPGEESYKDAALILQLLRDNLTLWNNKSGKDEENTE